MWQEGIAMLFICLIPAVQHVHTFGFLSHYSTMPAFLHSFLLFYITFKLYNRGTVYTLSNIPIVVLFVPTSIISALQESCGYKMLVVPAKLMIHFC